jgi:hypothetical protein
MGPNEIFRNAGPDPNTGVVLHMSVERWQHRMCCSPDRLKCVVGDSAILMPEHFFSLKQKIIKFRIQTESVEKRRIHFSQQVVFFLRFCCDEHSGGRASGTSMTQKANPVGRTLLKKPQQKCLAGNIPKLDLERFAPS